VRGRRRNDPIRIRIGGWRIFQQATIAGALQAAVVHALGHWNRRKAFLDLGGADGEVERDQVAPTVLGVHRAQGAALNGGIARRREDHGDGHLHRLIGDQVALPGQTAITHRHVIGQLNLGRGPWRVLRARNLTGQRGRLAERGRRLDG
jgi:hypothetical protein